MVKKQLVFKVLKPNKKRDKIASYLDKNPKATYREIQKALKLSSTAIVRHHLQALNINTLNAKNPNKKIDSLAKEIQEIEDKKQELENLKYEKIRLLHQLVKQQIELGNKKYSNFFSQTR
jgi:predicted transcriptional regulator